MPLEHQKSSLPDDPPIRFRRVFRLEGETGRGFTLVAFAPDGSTLAAGRTGGHKSDDVTLWDLRQKKLLHALHHTDDLSNLISAIAFVPPGDRLVTACMDLNKVFLWDARTDKLLDTLDTGGKPYYSVTGLAAFPDGKRVLCCAWDKLIVWDLEKKAHETLPWEKYAPPPNVKVPFCKKAAFTADGSRFVTSVGPNGARFLCWDAKTVRVTAVIPFNYSGFHLALAPDGSSVAATYYDPSIRGPHSVGLWDCASGKKLLSGQVFDDSPFDLSYTRDSKYLVMTGLHEHVEQEPKPAIGVWNVASGKLVNRIAPTGGVVNGLAVSPDNKFLALAGKDISIYAIEYADAPKSDGNSPSAAKP